MEKKFGLLFPGQGAQFVGMGKALYEVKPAAKWVFDRAGEVLDIDIKKLCFEGPEEELITTSKSQVAIFVTSIAVLNALVEEIKGSPVGSDDRELFSPEEIVKIGSVCMGLSLGEPVSLVASCAMSFEDGLKFVSERGRLMEEAADRESGKMASILGLDIGQVEKICNGLGCEIANLNAPGQIVISGPSSVVELATDLALNSGAKRAISLKVSGAFHSRLMAPAKSELEKVIGEIDVQAPAIDFISNLDACITRDPETIKKNLIDQLDHRTLWEKSINTACEKGVDEFLEIGPGSVLKGLARKINKNIKVTCLLEPGDIEALKQQI